MDVFPKISIITPSYNQGHFIESTILSVLNQNYPNLEYIIIDGGSTDDTVSIIKKYESKITYWVSEKDKGQADAINKGFSKCTGEIVGWLNSDDLYEKNTLFDVAKKLGQSENISFISGNFKSINEKGENIWCPQNNADTLYNSNATKLNLLKCWSYTLPQPSTFWKKDVFKKIGYLDATFHFAMDLEFWLRAIDNNLIIYRTDIIYSSFRRHSDAKSTTEIPLLQKDLQRLKNKYLKSTTQKFIFNVSYYIWFNSSFKIQQAISQLKTNKKQSILTLTTATLFFPLNLIFKLKLYLVYFKNLLFN